MTAVVAGYAGTKVVEPVGMVLYKADSPRIQGKEDTVRPGPPYQVAAKKTAEAVGLNCRTRPSTMPVGPLATGWRSRGHRCTGAAPTRQLGWPARCWVTGAAVSAVADETLTPLLGFSVPNRAYPLATHARGVTAYLVFGAAVGALSEAVWALTGRRPTNRDAGRSLGPPPSMLPGLPRPSVVSREGREL